MPQVIRNISGSMIGEASQKAMTGASGTPIARSAAMIGTTPQEQNGDSAPNSAAIRIIRAGLPVKARAITASAPEACAHAAIAAEASRNGASCARARPVKCNVSAPWAGDRAAISPIRAMVNSPTVHGRSRRANGREVGGEDDWLIFYILRFVVYLGARKGHASDGGLLRRKGYSGKTRAAFVDKETGKTPDHNEVGMVHDLAPQPFLTHQPGIDQCSEVVGKRRRGNAKMRADLADVQAAVPRLDQQAEDRQPGVVAKGGKRAGFWGHGVHARS